MTKQELSEVQKTGSDVDIEILHKSSKEEWATEEAMESEEDTVDESTILMMDKSNKKLKHQRKKDRKAQF